MKTLLVFAACVFLAQALTDEQKEKLKKHRSECLGETKVDEQLVNKLKTGDYKADNEALKKYALCMMIKSELMTKEGKFKKDVALAKVPNAADKAAVEKLIDTCLANKGNNPHQTAWNYVKCYHEKDPKHAIFLIIAPSGDWEPDYLGLYGTVLVGDQHDKSVITEEYDPQLHKRYQLECIEETRVNPDLVIKIKSGHFQSKPDVLLKLWVLCTMMKSGLMTPQGVYKYDIALARVPKSDAEFVGKIIDKCLSKKAIPPVDIAYNFVKCYRRRGNHTAEVTVA